VTPPRCTFLPRDRQPVTPWKNGGGSTRQVAIAPPDATVAGGFHWRVSCARMTADGPFSPFPGIDRSLWLVAGNGVVLTLPDRDVRLVEPLAQLHFAGELPVTARLVDGPIEDLNVMVDRRRARVDAVVAPLLAGATSRHVLAHGGTAILLALDGSVDVSAAEINTVRLEAGDALRLGLDDEQVVACTASTAARVLVAVFQPIAG
jgi:environmental stress-induced protein Ves